MEQKKPDLMVTSHVRGKRRKKKTPQQDVKGEICQGCGEEMFQEFKVCKSCVALLQILNSGGPTQHDIITQMDKEGYDLVNVYEFKKRRCLIFRHRKTGQETSKDIMKEK